MRHGINCLEKFAENFAFVEIVIFLEKVQKQLKFE